MNQLTPLIACAGPWQGTSTLQDPSSNVKDESPSTLTITPILKGTFVRIDYTWAYHGTPHDGSILLGCEKATNAITAYWCDTFHMSDKIMTCRGTADAKGALSILGSYAVPPGPDWGWRIVLTPCESLRLTMYNIWPDGKEELGVEGEYRRGSDVL